MIYDFKHKIQQLKAHEYLLKLIENEHPAELKRIAPKRSNLQNKYLHVLISLFALEYGDRADFVKKEILKEIVCPEIFKTTFKNRKTGDERDEFRSTAALDSAELSKVIDKFRTWSSKDMDIYLPSALEYKTDWITYLQEIENNKEYL